MIKFKYFLALFILLGISSTSFSQENDKYILGEVIDSTSSELLSRVVCKLLGKEGNMLNYGTTDNAGKFKIMLKDNAYYISFSCIGYKKRIINLKNIKNKAKVFLVTEAHKLDEVFVRVSPIKWSRDTITYNVAAFKEKQDRYLSDILKKLPGITVSKNGTISYQGKTISKFYIENQDLLGSNYNQATRSLPIDAVSNVQVLENHQHIKSLKNVAFTDRAAINIHLKSGYKTSLFGEVSAGVGASPLLWDNSLFLTKITSKNQALFTGKMNNRGQDISDEITEHIDFTDPFSYILLPDKLISSPMYNSFQIGLNRYLKNKSYTGGYNKLIKLSNNSNLRFNLLYYEDKTDQENHSISRYGNKDSITIKEDNDLICKSYSIVPKLQYEYNSESTYFLNDFKLSFSEKKYNNLIIENDKEVLENTKNIPKYFQNNLKIVFNNNDKVYLLNSFTRYYKIKENLSNNIFPFIEDIDNTVFLTKNSISNSFLLFNNRLDVAVNFTFKKEDLKNDLNMNNVDMENFLEVHDFSVQNVNNKQSKNKYKLGVSIEYVLSNNSKHRINFKLPISYNCLELEINNKDVSKHYISYLPSINFSHEFNDNFKMDLSAVYNYYTENDFMPSDIVYFTNYRTFYNSKLKLGESINKKKQLNFNSCVSYKDLASMLFINLTGIYSVNRKNNYSNYIQSYDFSETNPILANNKSKSLLISALIDKTFMTAGVAIKLRTDYSWSKYLFSQNEDFFYNSSNIVTQTLELRYKKLSWLSISYNLTANFSWQSYNNKNTDILKNYHHKLQMFIYPMSKLQLNINTNYSDIEITKGKYEKDIFLDFEVLYMLNKRIDLIFSATNIFNQKDYQISSETSVNYNFNSLALRKREFMIKLKYRL